MDKELVETFLTVATVRNISKASKLLYVSQATVSYRLKALERQVGAELVLRSKGIRRADLTDNGRRLLPLAKNWLEANQAFEKFEPQS
ncbi:LysR family transcriptional regulator [Acidaminococcus sp. NSJ-142]|jgi:DNA-binding transcriptional LysR family regulator|uniref:LysR family transcriptional regulator n=1 Tax=Acidaminococcus TaxID=904 RepID=UPI000CF96F58|nr:MULTISPECIES: LysR family transcriptional regulator [Acidaminococcus]MCD2434792.1 LysR family transcriptional regulator [Acidaminococcus hominis]MCH4095878.1 LysR family transcriptional regulator [Acidaminococcus provencensis]RHK02414.1 LysR family transcriptional regulator [Acidaminococcus sp. AM05-11]